MKPHVSAIIVNYKAHEAVEKLVHQVQKDARIEVLVHENSYTNIGYGAGCNAAAQKAQGEFFVFLNPDIETTASTLLTLADFLKNHEDVGVVGPQIQDENGSVQITCSQVPNPWQALMLYSFLGQLPFLRKIQSWYRLNNFSHTFSREVPSVNGSCFALRKQDFVALGGFDENLFLYFEEFDLALRAKQLLQKSVYFLGEVSVKHLGQLSTEQLPSQKLQHIFQASRQHWLQKHFGWQGLLVGSLLSSFEKKHV